MRGAVGYAPAALYPCGPSTTLRAALVALLALAGACVLAWSLTQGGGAAVPMLLYAGCALLLWRWLRRLPVGRLHWDGASWWLERAGLPPLAVAAPRIGLDLQSRLLLRVAGAPAGTCWLWLECAADDAPWRALRRALYAHAPVLPAGARGGGG